METPPVKKYKYVWSDLTDEARAKVENTEKGLRLIDEGIAMIVRREHYVHSHEQKALSAGRYAASCIADRVASLALASLRVVSVEETREEYERRVWEAYREHPDHNDLLHNYDVYGDMGAALDSKDVIHEGDGTEEDTPIFLGEHVLHTLTAFASTNGFKWEGE